MDSFFLRLRFLLVLLTIIYYIISFRDVVFISFEESFFLDFFSVLFVLVGVLIRVLLERSGLLWVGLCFYKGMFKR